jgi:hypothetical protein
VFAGAYLVVVIRGGERTSYDSWKTASAHVAIGDELRGYMPDGTTGYGAVIPRDDPASGVSRWKAVLLPW